MITIKINTVTQRPNPDFSLKVVSLAFCDVSLPELEATIRGVGLTWNGKRFLASCPKANDRAGGIGWNVRGRFANQLAEKMAEAFQSVGGKLPTAKPEKPVRRFIAASEIDLDGTPATWARNERIGLALDRMSKRDGCYYYTEVYERTEPDTLVDEADDHEAAEGLHRTLGVDAIAETMERAGL